MPQWFGVDTDWNDVRRMLTGIGIAKRVGVGHDPVTLAATAEVLMGIGIEDMPQEISLDDQAANTVLAGPTVGAAAPPTFRLLVGDDLGALLPQPSNQNEMLIADATPEWALLAAPVAQYQRLETGGAPFTPAWTINLTMTDDSWIGFGAGAGRFEFDSTPNPDQIKVTAADLTLSASHGVIHADGVEAGKVLRADGTRYIPAAASLYLPIAPVAQGDLIVADGTPEWSILTLAAGVGYALISTATTLVWDQTPVWTGDHVWDDGSGDSPAIKFMGGSHDDTASIFLDDSGTANNSDLAIRLCSLDDDSKVLIQDSGGNTQIALAANGDVGIGTVDVPHGGVGWAKVAIEGANNAATGPHMQFTTNADDYPLIQILPLLHDNFGIFFDAYHDGVSKSSDAGSNFFMFKNNDTLQFRSEAGIAAGNAITWFISMSIDAVTGNVSIGTSTQYGQLFVDQVDPTATEPTLTLVQRDVSEELIYMASSAAAGVLTNTFVDVGDVAAATPVGYFKVYVKDDGNQIVDGPYYVEFNSLA